MLSYKKILLLIVFGFANQQSLVSIENLKPKKKKRINIKPEDFNEILRNSKLEMKALIEAKKAEQEVAQKAQQEEEIQEELAKLQEWVNAPLLEKLSAKELLELQEAFARTPDNSTNLPESLSQMPAQDVLPPQQKREAQATEAAVKQAEEQERIEAERTEQSKREAAQKEAALQAKKEQIERAARIKLYQQKQAAEEEAKRVQEAEQKGQAAAASAKTASNIVTLADVKIRYTNLLGLPEQFDDTDRKIIIADLSTRDLQAMDTSQLGTVINQYDMKKPGALAYFVIGKVGQRVISKTYKMVSQQLVEPQEKANCGWQSVVNAIAVMKNHKGESFDNDGFGQHQEWVEADPIEVTWNHHARMLDGSVLPFAVIDRDLIVMGQRAIEYTQVAEHYKNPTDFLLEAVRVEFRKPGRQVFGLVVNTGSQNELANPYEHVGSRGSLPGALRHWYGVAILKHEDETKELVFIDSAGVSAEFLGQGAFVANRTRLNHNDPENTQLYALINQLVFE